jgi:hypothetical protein
MTSKESYTTDQAAKHALDWCAKNTKWKRICDIKDSDALMKTWEELPAKVRKEWEREYPSDPKYAWQEFGSAPCKVEFGFISGKGEFYSDVLAVPHLHNLMMIFKVGTKYV